MIGIFKEIAKIRQMKYIPGDSSLDLLIPDCWTFERVTYCNLHIPKQVTSKNYQDMK